MKKIVSISFIFLYLMLSVGVAKNTHYCMDRVKSIAYFSFEEDSCLPNEIPVPCCDNELELLKIEEDHQNSKQEIQGKKLFEITPLLLPIEFSLLVNDKEDVSKHNFEIPPPLKDEPLYLLNCSYTFYG